MPGHTLAVALGFADEVARKQRDVRPDDRFDKIQNLIGEKPFKQRGIGEVRHIHPLGPLIQGQRRQLVFKMFLQLLMLFLRKYRTGRHDVAFAGEVVHLFLGDAALQRGVSVHWRKNYSTGNRMSWTACDKNMYDIDILYENPAME